MSGSVVESDKMMGVMGVVGECALIDLEECTKWARRCTRRPLCDVGHVDASTKTGAIVCSGVHCRGVDAVDMQCGDEMEEAQRGSPHQRSKAGSNMFGMANLTGVNQRIQDACSDLMSALDDCLDASMDTTTSGRRDWRMCQDALHTVRACVAKARGAHEKDR